MAIPVIDETTSYLEAIQWQPFEFQPAALNVPTTWTCPNLPQGLSINSSTGLISGAVQAPGPVYSCLLVASNVDGSSEPLVITIGVRAAEATLTASGFTGDFDVATRVLALADAGKLFGAVNDDFMILLRIKKGSAVLDLDVDKMELSLREFVPDNNLVLSTGFTKFGSGVGTYYALTGTLSGDPLKAAISSYARPKSQIFTAKAQLEIVENYTPPETWAEAPSTLRYTSRYVDFEIAGEFGQAA